MIDVENVDSYPRELENYIMSNLLKMPSDIVAKIKNKEIKYEIDVKCAIEGYLDPSSSLLYEKLFSIMDKHDLLVYHGTKILNKSMVLEDGLKINDWDRYSICLSKTCKALGMSDNDIKETISYVKHEYDRKGLANNVYTQLCFFSGLNLIDGTTPGYEQFCENMGGELARWALKEKYPDKYKPLKENGEACIVKFKLPFADIILFRKETILCEFVSYYVAKEFFKFPYQIQFDGMTTKDIPSNNILEIIPYTKEISY